MITERVTKDYVFFWKGWLSNFWRAPFKASWPESPMKGWPEFKEWNFFCTEQYFMFLKACVFGDHVVGKLILNAQTAQEARNLGQKVRGYTDEVWAPLREKVMEDANMMKYSQNPALLEKLLNPEWREKHFVEASPFDRTWSIGISVEDSRCEDPMNWRGQNLLGKCLDIVRQRLLEGT